MGWRAKAGQTARRLQWHGSAGLILAGFAPLLGPAERPGRWLLAALCVVLAAQSAHLLFDAALLRRAMAQPTEAEGLAAIDAGLARLGLRRAGTVPRPLPPRLAGCRRLLHRQCAGLALVTAAIIMRWLGWAAVA